MSQTIQKISENIYFKSQINDRSEIGGVEGSKRSKKSERSEC